MISIGFDIGGTNTKIAVVNDKYKILKKFSIQTPVSKGYKNFIKELSFEFESLKKEFDGEKLAGLTIAIAGDVDSDNGILRYAPNLRGWRNKNIRDDFREISKISPKIENDANMAAWGVYSLEIKKKVKNLVIFTLGTGIGGGIIIDGRLYRGFTSTAAELGHMVIVQGGERCNCGNYGCLEAYCGGYALIREAKKRVDIKRHYSRFKMLDKLTPKIIFEAAKHNDKISIEIWKKYGYHLGTGIGNILVSLNPQMVVLCGGVSRAYKFFIPALKDRLSEYQIKTPVNSVKIKVSLNSSIGVMGSAIFAMEG